MAGLAELVFNFSKCVHMNNYFAPNSLLGDLYVSILNLFMSTLY